MSDGTPGRPAKDSGTNDAPPSTSHFYGPVFHGDVTDAQLAWNNTTVTQNQARVQQVTPGFEEIAEIVREVLRRLADLDLPADDAQDLTENANQVLAEVVRPEPDRGLIRRCLTAIKGTLAQLATGLLTGARQGAVEIGRELIHVLGRITV